MAPVPSASPTGSYPHALTPPCLGPNSPTCRNWEGLMFSHGKRNHNASPHPHWPRDAAIFSGTPPFSPHCPQSESLAPASAPSSVLTHAREGSPALSPSCQSVSLLAWRGPSSCSDRLCDSGLMDCLLWAPVPASAQAGQSSTAFPGGDLGVLLPWPGVGQVMGPGADLGICSHSQEAAAAFDPFCGVPRPLPR